MAKLKGGRHTSALKALRQSLRRRKHNKRILETLKVVSQQVVAAVKKGEADKIKGYLSRAVSLWNRAAQKHVVSRNRASRVISRLSRLVVPAG